MVLVVMRPNDVTAGDFLSAIFGGSAGDAHVTAFARDPGSDQVRGRWAGNLARRTLHTFRPDENQYYVVSLFDQDYVDQVTGRATRRKHQFRSMHVVVIDDVALGDDLGDGRKVRESDVLARLAEPSFRLLTSPANCQFGYILRDPIRERAEAEALIEQMIAHGLTADGADPGMKGVTRYVRLPAGVNSKAKYITAENPLGFPIRLLAWNPEHRTTPVAIAAAWGFDLRAAVAAKTEAEVHQELPNREVAQLDPSWASILPAIDHRHAADFTAADLEMAVVRGTEDDPLLKGLRKLGLIKARCGRGMFEITCPFAHTHTGRADNGTAFMPGGGIACHHGHCVGRTRGQYAGEVARRLRQRGDSEAFRIADMLAPRITRLLERDPFVAIERELRAFDAAKRKSDFNERRAMLRLAVELGHYVAASAIPEEVIRADVGAELSKRDVGTAAWLNAWDWGRRTAQGQADARST
jgi:hypothetical protein